MSIEAQEARILNVAAWITGIIAVIWCVGIISGCNTILPAVIDAVTNTPPAVVTNLVPAVTKPVTTSKPYVDPLKSHGTVAEVDRWLSDGGAPESDNRSRYKFQLLQVSGKSWSYANFVESGCVAGGKAHAVAFEGQWYTPVYQSAHDQGLHMPGHPLKDGDTLGGERFVYFRCQDL